MQPFSDFDLKPALRQALDAAGFTNSTAIQAAALPIMLAERDIIAQAATGSGKTAAFGLACLQRLDIEQTRIQGLLLCPTRELAEQVAQSLRQLASAIPNVKILSLCGGMPIREQLNSLVHPPHFIVGTPGRIGDLLAREALDLTAVHTVVLDEADRMLDMGFLDAISEILLQVPKQRCTWLFSATYPAGIEHLSRRFQNYAAKVKTGEAVTEPQIEQRFYEIEQQNKFTLLLQLLKQQQAERCLLFTHTKNDARSLCQGLAQEQIDCLALHGDLEQRERDEALLQFANHSCRVLVTTDVAARGLDIEALPLVITYELPFDPHIHQHRIGRTGRAGQTGLAISLVAPEEMPRALALTEELGLALNWCSQEQPDTPYPQLPKAAMRTLCLSAGKRDKLRPGDILGALTGDIGLDAKAVGKIKVLAIRAYVAVQHQQAERAVEGLNQGKIKKKRVRAWLLS